MMDVEVHCLSGKKYNFKIDAAKTVYDVKGRICANANRSLDSQALLLTDEEVSNSTVLASLGTDAIVLQVLFVNPDALRKERVSKFLADRASRELAAKSSAQNKGLGVHIGDSQEDVSGKRLAPLSLFPLEMVSHAIAGVFGAFEVPKQYGNLEFVCGGKHSDVCSAQDLERGERVAIKKISDVFQDVLTAKRTLRELRILRHLQHENIVSMRRVFFSGDKESFEDVYMVEDLMQISLHCVIKDVHQVLTNDHCKYFFYQILRGLKFVHSAGVIHRDLKPRNLLVNANCDLKICDFGLARVHLVKDESQNSVVTVT